MSKVVPRWKGKVQGGYFVPFMEYESEYQHHMNSLESKVCYMSITDKEPDRSDAQNRYYRAVIVRMTAEEIGITEDEAHALLGSLFLKEYVTVNAVNKKTGEVIQERHTVIQSTTSLTKDKMKEYIEQCLRWASMELGLYIPDSSSIEIK